MLSILFTVAPVFLLIGVGYAAVRLGALKDTLADALNAFAVRLAVPVLLFDAMARLDLQQAFAPAILTSYYAGALSCFVLGILAARFLYGRRPGESVSVGFSATYTNLVLIGIPIIERVYGEQAVTLAFGIIALQSPLIYTIGMATMELMRRGGRPLGETMMRALKSIATNPLMIGIIAGLCFNLLGLRLPGPLATTVDMLATAAIPVALVGIGAALIRYRLTATLPETATIAALSLVVHPVIAFVVAHHVLGLPPLAVHVAVAMAALPPGVNVYVFATLYDRAVGLVASALLSATALAVITVTLWLYVLTLLAPT